MSANAPLEIVPPPRRRLRRATGREIAPARARMPVVLEFQPDAIELEERTPPRIARMTLYMVTALIASAVVWACVSSMDEVVVAPGKLVTTKPTIIVQPLETSIVRSLDVSVGDIVHAGQTLATLDATFTQSDVDQQRSKFAALDAQSRRIEAELDGSGYAVTAGQTPDQALQAALFGQRHAFYMAQLENFDEQIAGRASVIASGTDQAAILRDRQDTLGRIEAARQTLYDNQTGSLLNLLGSRDARLDVASDLARVQGAAVEAGHEMSKLKADRQAFIEDFRRASMEQLVGIRSERDAAADELKKMELRRDMVTLTAPADAIVLDLAQRSIGSVVREAEPIVTLVPLDVPLEAEVSVHARDIGRLEIGEPVRIKFEAFPFQKFGTASGTIRTISRDAFPGDPAAATAEAPARPFFKARVLLADTDLRNASRPVQLLPGMSVTAEIKVGRRKVISYFLYPVLRILDDSIREP